MKILQILPELNSGGVERGVLEISHYLIAQGHQALVVSSGGRLVVDLEKLGARHIALPVQRKSPMSLLQVRPLRRILIQEQPDILHIRSRLPGWIAWLAWRRLPPATRPHLVTTVHGFYSVNAYSAIMMRGERVIAVSQSILDYIQHFYPLARPEIIRVIPRGIEPADYPCGFRPAEDWRRRWQAEYPQLAGQSVLLLPGRITRLKGHEDFLELIAALRQAGKQAHGLIVGEAHPRKRSYLAELRQRVDALGLRNSVTFTGHRSDLREIMAVSDIVFSLSGTPESFGRTTLEALALGRPVVAYDHGGVGEQLRALFTAGLVPVRNIPALLATTRSVLAGTDPPLVIAGAYTLANMCQKTLAAYRELTALSGLHPP